MFDKVIRYTRGQALADGVLVDAGDMAKEAGLKWPVALTAAAWAKCVAVPEGVECQDEKGRLWDVLWMLRVFLRGSKGDTVYYRLHVRNDNGEGDPPLVHLKAVSGPGDEGEPVITIMLPEED